MSKRNSKLNPDFDIQEVKCLKGHKLRQREWADRAYCLEGECLLPKTCSVAMRNSFIDKCKESLEP